jgi:hypothetical protein
MEMGEKGASMNQAKTNKQFNYQTQAVHCDIQIWIIS